jgi:mannan endo-1,4-beta-mannosidase
MMDMLSLDMYDRGEQFNAELDSALKFVATTAILKKKLTALSETGARRGMSDWWSTVLLPIVSKYPVGYVLTWRHTYRMNLPGTTTNLQPFPDDFMNFYNSTRTLFLKEIRQADIYKRAEK